MRILVLATLAATPVLAQERAPEPVIQVTGTGVVETVPDVATLAFWLRGEGASADDATRAVAAKQKAVTDGLRSLLGAGTQVTTAEVIVIEARGEACQDARGYGSQPRLSEGACAVRGYVATVQGAVRTGAVDKAGTAAGLASRLGASDARLTGFALSDPGAAQRRATAAAIADARRRAEAAAQGAGVRLGAIRLVRDQNFGSEVVVSGFAPPAPPPPPAMMAVSPPIPLDTRPRPVETRTQVQVAFAIAG
jgi:uncharacterized protein